MHTHKQVHEKLEKSEWNLWTLRLYYSYVRWQYQQGNPGEGYMGFLCTVSCNKCMWIYKYLQIRCFKKLALNWLKIYGVLYVCLILICIWRWIMLFKKLHCMKIATWSRKKDISLPVTYFKTMYKFKKR